MHPSHHEEEQINRTCWGGRGEVGTPVKGFHKYVCVLKCMHVIKTGLNGVVEC